MSVRDDQISRTRMRRRNRNEWMRSAASVYLRTEIPREHSKRQAVKTARWIGKDNACFGKLFALFLHDERRVTQRAAWIINQCAENHPGLVTAWLQALVKKMQEPGAHDVIKRSVARILQNAIIPRPLLSTIVSVCFEYLASPTSPIAVKSYSMAVLLRAAEIEPDLYNELRASVEPNLLYGHEVVLF